MKKYYVKLGNMYLKNIYLDKDLYANNFIEEIEFSIYKKYAIQIEEKDKFYVMEKLEHCFNMPGALKDYIEFEEVIEDEQNN